MIWMNGWKKSEPAQNISTNLEQKKPNWNRLGFFPRRLIPECMMKTQTKDIINVDDEPDLVTLPTLPSVLSVLDTQIPDKFLPWIKDKAERLQCPIDYLVIPAMVSFGATVGSQLAVKPKVNDDWYRYPFLWGLIVGKPSTLKSPAMDEALGPVKRIESKYLTTYQEKSAENDALEVVRKAQAKETAKKVKDCIESEDTEGARKIALTDAADEPEAVIRQRLVVQDATQEKAAELLRDNPRGLLIVRDEMSGFLKQMEKQGRESERAFWLEGWNGEGVPTTDRIGRGTVDAPIGGVSIVGGIQPGPLSSYMKTNQVNGDDGFMQRFQMACYPDAPASWKKVDTLPDLESKNTANSVFSDFADLDTARVGATLDKEQNKYFLQFDKNGQGLFDEWLTTHMNRLRRGVLSSTMESHLAKYPSLVPSLAMLIQLAEHSTGPISEQSTLKALAWADYLESHAERIYSPVTAPEIDAASLIVKRIENGSLSGWFSQRDIYRKRWSGLTDSKAVAAGIELLVDHGYVIPETEETGGRPKTIYRANARIQMKVAA